jgi:hypothetical protein
LDWFTETQSTTAEEKNYCDGAEAFLKYKRVLETIDFSDRMKVVLKTGG